ncbi:efflux RND transporter permease subunit, partial [bacterium]|nr:efflux RND transporter permease subunit [bacterium]
MKKIIAFLVTYPIWSNVLLVSLFVFSALSLAKINSSSFPELPADKIFVNVSFPGSSPEEVEEGVILKIEDNLEGIEGIDRVTSVSQENSGSVTVELEKGYPIDDVLT